MSAYGPTTVKRQRRTNDELDRLDDAIIAAVATEYPVSVRGVYYRVVSAGAVPKTDHGYRAVSRQLVKLRASGRVPYRWITDGTRLRHVPDTWADVDAMLSAVASSYRRTLWHRQPTRVIVLSEKDAISGVVWPVLDELDVELCITRGYSSVTFVHSIAQTCMENTRAGTVTHLYQLGDHDPSGVDAWRDFEAKVSSFAPDAYVVCQRLAVTPEQIEAWDLPTRPSKATDSRAGGFTGGSVEVDAIPPTRLRKIVRDAIEPHLDPDLLALTRKVEEQERIGLRWLRDEWPETIAEVRDVLAGQEDGTS